MRRLKHLVVGQIICIYKSFRRGHFDILSPSPYAEKQVKNWLVQHEFMNMVHLNMLNVVHSKDINSMDGWTDYQGRFTKRKGIKNDDCIRISSDSDATKLNLANLLIMTTGMLPLLVGNNTLHLTRMGVHRLQPSRNISGLRDTVCCGRRVPILAFVSDVYIVKRSTGN